MQKIGLSFYLTFICLVIGLVVGVAMLAPAPKKPQRETSGAVSSASADQPSPTSVEADQSSEAEPAARSSIASVLHFIASPSTDARPASDKASAKQTTKTSAEPTKPEKSPQPVASQTTKTELPKTPVPKKAERPATP
ncbi:MAG: hypothetical protein AAGG72_10965, partial [Pseudomonadota bacterium]